MSFPCTVQTQTWWWKYGANIGLCFQSMYMMILNKNIEYFPGKMLYCTELQINERMDLHGLTQNNMQKHH